MVMNRKPADLATMNRNQLRDVARGLGVPLRLTKGAMLREIEQRFDSVDEHRERQGLRAQPVRFYHPADPLEGMKLPSGRSVLTTTRVLSRFNRRHDIHQAPHPSKNPMRPSYFTTNKKRPVVGAMVPYVAPRDETGAKIKPWR